jgi:hypothetical protein
MNKCSSSIKEINQNITERNDSDMNTSTLVSPSQASRLAAVMDDDTPNHDHMVRPSGCSVATA